MQTLKSIFSHSERAVATPYIHALAPRLVEYLYATSAQNIANEGELALTGETIATVEMLITLAEPQHRKYTI